MPNQHKPSPPTRPPTQSGGTEIAPSEKPAGRPTIHLDCEEWLPYLDDPDATDEEKRELIETLWGIVLSFVDLGWTIQTEPSRGSNLPPETGASSIDFTTRLSAIAMTR